MEEGLECTERPCQCEANEINNFRTSQTMVANSNMDVAENPDGWFLRWVSHDKKTYLRDLYCHRKLVPKVCKSVSKALDISAEKWH